jgi:Predicted membrane protein
MPPVRAALHCFFYLTDGEATVDVGRNNYLIHKNECVIIPEGQIFTVKSHEKCKGYMGGFHNEFLLAVQQKWKFLGVLVSAATVGGVMIILKDTYGFVGDGALVAPQANALAAVVDPLMSGTGAPWILYGVGAIIAIILNFCKIPALAFALGMFIPLSLNVPLLVGGAVSWYVTTRSKNAETNKERGEKGTLLASGLIAGGALMGVVSASLKFGDIDLGIGEWAESQGAEILSIVMYALLVGFLVWQIMKKVKAKN